VGVRGVCCQGKHSVGGWMHQQYSYHQRTLGRLEGGGGRWPGQRLGVPPEGVSEGLQLAGNTWQKMSVNSTILKNVVTVSHPVEEENH
jgi:hypothetical protein